MKRGLALAIIGFVLCFSEVKGEGPDLTFTTVSAVSNSDGSELITTVLYEYSDGTSFLVDYHFTPSGVSTPGGGFIAPISNFPITANLPQGGSWGPGPYPGPGGGGPGNEIIHGVGSDSGLDQLLATNRSIGDEPEYQPNWVPVVVGGAACVISHIVSTRAKSRACEEDGIDSMRTGYCGFFGHVDCNDPPPPPPPEPDASFWSGTFQLNWYSPDDWDWPNSGPYVVTDGF